MLGGELMPQVLMGAIGDDLTGSVELAALLAAGGARVSMYTDPEAVAANDGSDAIVIAQRSRVAPVKEARAAFARCADRLLQAGARQLFFKYCATFDSLPTGNIGPCADVLADRLDGVTTLFCPTYAEPSVDRTVYRGHMFVGDKLLSNSAKRFDPLTPMTEANLVAVLQAQTTRRVGLVPLSVVASGPEAIRRSMQQLQASGILYAIVDALTEDDLRDIARATWDWPLMTGGASVAAHYPAIWRDQGLLEGGTPQPFPHSEAAGAVLSGSCAERTREQIACFAERHPVLQIDLLDQTPTETVVHNALQWAATRLSAGPVCIATSSDEAAVEAAQRAWGREGAARRAEMMLGGVAQGLVGLGVGRLVIAGGETSGAVMDALDIKRLTVAPFTSPGIGLCATSAPKPLSLCLKSGKLGAVDLFETALEKLRKAA
jgi:3-dehydrotetronate 4-kinase